MVRFSDARTSEQYLSGYGDLVEISKRMDYFYCPKCGYDNLSETQSMSDDEEDYDPFPFRD